MRANRPALGLLVVLAGGTSPGRADPVDAKAAARAFRASCAACHGAGGRGDTPIGRAGRAPDFTSPEFQRARTDAALRAAIAEGRPGTKMAPFGDKLAPALIDALVAVIRGFGGAR